jgi:superfamily II DNA or RNA helicase
MPLLRDHPWKAKYDSDTSDFLQDFYIPALTRAQRYDRATGYFSASVLTRAARGIEGLVANEGHMRLIVGATLGEDEAHAIEQGQELAATVGDRLSQLPLDAEGGEQTDALELLAWMVAQGHLEVRVAVPCGESRKPVPAPGIFHAKTGIVEDAEGDRIAFSGSVNETAQGWLGNWESFHVFRDWDGGREHVDDEESTFARLWRDEAQHARVVDVSEAVRSRLLEFHPPDGQKPRRLGGGEEQQKTTTTVEEPSHDARREAWRRIWEDPTLGDGGERIGEATCPVEPWPHQLRTFYRMYEPWPPRLLIADEVGLGKTITAGLLLRQAWLSGRAKRILILAPAAVLGQWQLELREKFNLNWPIYDGSQLRWAKCPSLGEKAEAVALDKWHCEPIVLASSQLMRRRDRRRELLDNAERYDLVVLDEAHHARRSGAGSASGGRPNMLLTLMRDLRDRTDGLLLLTATPMQIDPVEVWDLLDLLGLPQEWSELSFMQFFEKLAGGNPSHVDLAWAARLFNAVERDFGETPRQEAERLVGGTTNFAARKVLVQLRAPDGPGLRALDTQERRGAVKVLQANSPIRRRIARHTRTLLRRYRDEGVADLAIADRDVRDEFIDLSERERAVYEAVEDYISSTYENAAAGEKSAVGFVMTVYRRRMASSFHALVATLGKRWDALGAGGSSAIDGAEDADDDELREDVMDTDEAQELARQSLLVEERHEIEFLLSQARRLPTDTKATRLLTTLRALQDEGRRQAMVFTQYGDTMDFLRDYLAGNGLTVMCFSGAGGAVETGGRWTTISRDDVKQRFRDGYGEVLLCTDAAAEGLNFQFCGALVNYDMPWNPMRVEQRIGRIDRLGQAFSKIRVVNMHYRDTVETDVYEALRGRVSLFEQFVGPMQPILSKLPRDIGAAVLAGRSEREGARRRLIDSIAAADIEAPQIDLDPPDELVDADLDVAGYPPPLYGMDALDAVLRDPALLPPGLEADATDASTREYTFTQPGMARPVRVTTQPRYYEENPESVVLWSPGAPVFPTPPGEADA